MDPALAPMEVSPLQLAEMILVQVGPGEAFTVPPDGGNFQYITGPVPLPMLPHSGTMAPPVFLPPSYVPQVMEDNSMCKLLVLPHAVEFLPSLGPPPVPHLAHYPLPQAALLPHSHMYPAEMHPHYLHHIHTVPVYSSTEQDPMCQTVATPSLKLQEPMSRRLKDRPLSIANTVSARPSHAPDQSYCKGAHPSLHNGHSKPPTNPDLSARPPKHNTLSGQTSVSSPLDSKSIGADGELRRMGELLSSVCKPTVSSLTCRSAVLSWRPAGADKHTLRHTPPPFCYELALSQSAAEGDFRPVYQGTDTTYTISKLRPATQYYVRVCAASDSVKGTSSEVVCFTTLCAPPDPPKAPRLLLRTKNSLGIEWKCPKDNGSKILAYLLECSEGKQENFREAYCGSLKQFKLHRLTPSTKYTFRVAARNQLGVSAFSEVLTCCTAGCAPPPPAPPRLRAAGVSWLSLEWSAPCGPPSRDTFTHLLEMEEGPDFKPQHVGQELSYTVKNLQRCTAYHFRVLVANSEGCSQPSAVVKYWTCADPPTCPSRLRLHSPPLSHSIHTIWDAPEDDGGSPISHYVLELSHTDDAWEAVYTGLQTEYVCEGLDPGPLYKVRVYCQNRGGQSQVSEILSVRTAPVHPGPCRALRVSDTATNSEIPLSWEAPVQDGGSAVCVYAVEMAAPSGVARAHLFEGPELCFTARALQPAATYRFWVRAGNQAGWGPWSEACEASTAAGSPGKCGPPKLTVTGPASLQASWEEPVCNASEVCEFRLEWGEQRDALSVVSCGPSTSHVLTDLRPATEYFCRIQAINNAGIGPVGDMAVATTLPSVPAVVEGVEEMRVTTSPSPTQIALQWKEPCCHGAEILGYNIDLGEQLPLSVGKTSQYLVDRLQPNTTYRVRVQAVNSVGAGPLSSILKVRTAPLPPNPPMLECTVLGPHTLKLRWGEGSSRAQLTRGTLYSLHMQDGGDRMPCVYRGPCHSFKLQRLREGTEYCFCIQAIRGAGTGPLSPLYRFCTARSPPPQLKAPKIELVDWNEYTVTWETLQPMRGDFIIYTLQLLRGKEAEQVYCGPAASYTWHGTPAGSDWRVRVCAGRQRPHGTALWGQYSLSTAMENAEKQQDARPVGILHGHCRKSWTITDELFAFLVLLAFGIVAILFAALIQYFLLNKD
ncbi:fibronectin type-III domain-containing protein 3A-like [Denticeps clupeoides]|nr:fibronectin type-III domain-containing protein 3A-like [Denticeps clupeoides]XP_028816612.1 fibronectin type-III domain-containing protein 3A-like [Denticeps clupeoides]XP_028816613.1 fibronectin type-III domain-containing protein 3A-like [Denticeps clupeoides]